MDIRETTVLNYFYESNRIPIWVFREGKPVYSSVPAEKLRPEKEVAAAFGRFFGRASETPSVLSVSGMELLAFFCFSDGIGAEECRFIAGPVFYSEFFRSDFKGRLLSEYIYPKERIRARLSDTPVVDVEEFCRFVGAAAALLQGKAYSVEELKACAVIGETENNEMDSVLAQAIFGIREEELLSLYDLEDENRLISAIRRGDWTVLNGLKKFSVKRMRAPFAEGTRHQREYEVVALVTIATRAAVSGGVDVDTAFSLSDLYLKKIDRHRTEKELEEIAVDAIRTFCSKVAEQKEWEIKKYSPKIQRCIRYIRAYLHYPISLEEASEYLETNPKYLSRNFFRETGIKFSDFIRRERVKEACVLLSTSDMPYIDIANSLAFSSQSYFIKVFSEIVGVTPRKYRENKQAQFSDE